MRAVGGILFQPRIREEGLGAREEGRLKDEDLMSEGRRKDERRTLNVQRERTGSKVEGGLAKDGGSKTSQPGKEPETRRMGAGKRKG